MKYIIKLNTTTQYNTIVYHTTTYHNTGRRNVLHKTRTQQQKLQKTITQHKTYIRKKKIPAHYN